MNERTLIATIRKACAANGAGLVAGIGDDCAIVRPGAREDVLVTTDFLLEGVHFTRATHGPGDCGWKALARGLSDIAAMGGRPRWAFVSLALAPDCGARWVSAFYRDLRALAGRHNVVVAGGDLTRHVHLLCDMIVLGTVRRGQALRRAGARVGDHVYVTGTLGASALGLATQRGAAWRRHKRPEPRVAAGLQLRRFGATACLDLSDGIALDARRLAEASGLAIALDGTLPLARGVTLEQALGGGEDYELLFTAPASRPIPDTIGNVPVTRIGSCHAGAPGALSWAGQPLEACGWDPFRR
jgi:thiamine-monophosphate kinase